VTVLRDKVSDPEFRPLVDDILAGRKSLDTFTSPAFYRALNPLVGEAVQHHRSLPEEERRELAGAGEQQFERSRREEKKRVAARTGRGRRGLQRPELVALDPGRSSTASCSTGPGSRHRCRVSSLTVGSFASP
jgi:hypothetical protein